ncbi:DUF4232 domain-containing protein [Streptomyces sp. NPDC051742]|uniref:DUF4232 domain-containing protein n=1 Tax=unclassified Streptomyces TaxID=2593676 RepID=UPI00342C8ED9
MRAARQSWKTYALGAAAVAALLSSTACQPGGSTIDVPVDPKPSGTPSATDSAKPGTPSATGSAKPGTGTPAATESGSVSDGTAKACADPDLSIATSYWPKDNGQHMLITATNVTDKPCTLYHYPFVYFGQDNDNPLGPMESKPTAVATIGPKEKAYAGMKLFLGGEKTTTYTSFGLGYHDPNSNNDGSPVDVSLSGEVDFVTVGPNPSVTFWNRDRSEVEKYVFKAG